IFYRTKHPYTQGLLDSIPNLEIEPGSRLKPIPGSPPDLTQMGDFCAFSARCPRAQTICTTKRPSPSEAEPGHLFECYFPLTQNSQGQNTTARNSSPTEART